MIIYGYCQMVCDVLVDFIEESLFGELVVGCGVVFQVIWLVRQVEEEWCGVDVVDVVWNEFVGRIGNIGFVVVIVNDLVDIVVVCGNEMDFLVEEVVFIDFMCEGCEVWEGFVGVFQ